MDAQILGISMMILMKKIWPFVVGLGVVTALAVSVGTLLSWYGEVAALRADVKMLTQERDELKDKNYSLFSLLLVLVKDGTLSLVEITPFITPTQESEISKEASVLQKERLPNPLEVKFYPSGRMGDGESGQYVTLKREQSVVQGHDVIVIRINYSRGPKGWAGIYWQYPDNNWGGGPGRNLLGAKAITFLARGERGGEIVEFKSGGIKGNYKDTYEASLGKVILSQDWQKYSIDLSQSDLSSVIGAFAWIIAASDIDGNSATTYLAEIMIE